MKQYFDPVEEPLQLFVKLPDGTMKEQTSYACAHCKHILYSKEAAATCCRQKYCTGCNEKLSYANTTCSNCQDAARAKKAVVIDEKDYDGPVSDGEESFWDNMAEYLDSVSPGEELEFLYCCTVVKFKDANAKDLVEGMLENELSDHHEDGHDQIVDEDSLVSAVQTWLDKQTMESWYPDYKRKILVPTLVEGKEDGSESE